MSSKQRIKNPVVESNGKFYKLGRTLAARRDLRPTDKLIMAVLADRIGGNGTCWPGLRSLARDTGLRIATVHGSLTRLELVGDIVIIRQGSGKTNHYKVIDKSVTETGTPKSKCYGNRNSGVTKTVTEALRKPEQNQTDQLNKTHIGSNGEAKKFTDLWNSRERLPRIRAMTGKRQKAFAVRMAEAQFSKNWQTIIQKAADSDFLCGDNDRGWKVDIEWLLKNDTNYVRVLEGKYDSKPKSKLKQGDFEWYPTEAEADAVRKEAGLA